MLVLNSCISTGAWTYADSRSRSFRCAVPGQATWFTVSTQVKLPQESAEGFPRNSFILFPVPSLRKGTGMIQELHPAVPHQDLRVTMAFLPGGWALCLAAKPSLVQPRPRRCLWGTHPPSATWWLQLGCFTRSPTAVGGSLPYLREDFTEVVHRSETCHLVCCKISGGTMRPMCMSPSPLCPSLPAHSRSVGALISQRKNTEREFLKTKNKLWMWLKPTPPAHRRHSICAQRVLSP